MALALGIETSCDDCSVAVVNHKGEVLFLNQNTQSHIHKRFGGIVPELASRQHGKTLLPLISQALQTVPLSRIDLIAVTNRPGLLGSLLTGCVTAKTLSLAWNKPLIGINHIEAHIFSPFVFKSKRTSKSNCVLDNKPFNLDFPALAFVVSGGHSLLFDVKDIGQSTLLANTRDDSAGEAFDKFARLLGLEWPGGPAIDNLAKKARVKQTFFSKINTNDLSFSFSGIKSSGQRLIASHSKNWITKHKTSICENYQKTIIDHLMEKFKEAFYKKSYRQVLIGGGVSANSYFRASLTQWSKNKSVKCLFPEKTFCTDNAAMIAFLGLQYFLTKGRQDDLNMPCSPNPLKHDFFS